MSEHWKSTPKYWCKHCAIYVKDTPFERKQHETTGKHQGNLKRFLNTIQKNHAKNEREKDYAKAEVERVHRIAGTGNALAPLANPLTSASSSKPSANTLSAVDQKRQWAQLAEMGIAAPGAPDAHVAVPGDWQVLSRKVVPHEPDIIDDKLNVGVRKRKFDDQEEEEEEAGETVVRRAWGSATKIYPGTTPVAHDLDSVLASTVFKKRTTVQERVKGDIQDVPLTDIKAEDSTSQPSHLAGIGLSSLEESRPGELEVKTQFSDDGVNSITDKNEEMFTPVFKKRRPKNNQPSRVT